jgi:serine/threonine-protein kinase
VSEPADAAPDPAAPASFKRLRELFDRVSELPVDARDAAIAAWTADDPRLGDELRALLRHAGRSDSLLDGGALRLSSPGEALLPEVPGFRLLRHIGRGGSANVYLAEQEREDFSREVALKVVDRVVDALSLRQVREEQRILARLEHPGIARLYDTGVTPLGQPFLAMELVEGESILEHCRSGQLPLRGRLELFLSVLDAVAYAHGEAVVHRDLKPANILVSSRGEAKLLDFGIAKLVADPGDKDETRTLRRAMTPAYASPEQVRGDRVTASSDIYSLGVVLYELLTGTLPYRLEGKRFETFADAIREQEPEPPSVAFTRTARTSTTVTAPTASRRATARGRRELRGDLDAVVLKALRKDPADRYATAADLAQELRRYLEGTPVLARRDLGYRLRSFVHRHRARGAALAIVVTLAAVALVARRSGLSARPTTAPDPALFPWRWVAIEEPELSARYLRALENRAAGRAAAASTGLRLVLSEHPQDALVWAAFADSLALAGRSDEARDAGNEAMRHVAGLPRESRLLVEAIALREAGKLDESVERLRSLALLHPDNLEIALLLGRTVTETGGAAEALALADSLRARPQSALSDLRLAYMQLSALDRLGRQKEIAALAEPVATRAIEQSLPALAARFLSYEGHAWDQLGESVKAKAVVPRLRQQAALSGEPRSVALGHGLACFVAIREARHNEVESECNKGLDIYRRLGSHRSSTALINLLGASRRRRGRLEEARAAFLEAWQISQRLGDRTLGGRFRSNLANTDLDLGRYEAAEQGFREVVELRRTDGDTRSRALALRGLASAMTSRGRLRDAEPPLLEAEKALREAKGRELPLVLVTLAELRQATGDPTRAAALFDEAIRLHAAGEEPDNVAYVRALRATLEGASGANPSACETLARSAETLRGVEDRRVAEVLAWEASCRARAGDLRAAARALAAGDAAVATSTAPAPRIDLALARAELELVQRQPAAALRTLERAAADCRARDHVAKLFEVRLLAARAEAAQGASPERLRTLLETLRDDARAQRFEEIAGRAAALLAKVSR